MSPILERGGAALPSYAMTFRSPFYGHSSEARPKIKPLPEEGS